MFGSDLSSKDADDDKFLEEEEEEEEEEEDMEGLRIDMREFNFEIPEVLHQVFLHLTAKEIVNIGRVSKSWRKVATSDLLWGFILKNKDSYIAFERQGSGTLAFFYDLKPRGDDLYTKFLYKFRRAYLRNVRIEKRKKQLEFQAELERKSEPYCVILFMCLMGCTSVLVPPVGILLTFFVGMYKAESLELGEAETEQIMNFIVKISSTLDLIIGLWLTLGGAIQAASYCLFTCGTCCYCCGLCCLQCVPFAMVFSCLCYCITAPNIAVWALAGWLGRFYFAEDAQEPEMIILVGSPAIGIGYATAAGIYYGIHAVIEYIDRNW